MSTITKPAPDTWQVDVAGRRFRLMQTDVSSTANSRRGTNRTRKVVEWSVTERDPYTDKMIHKLGDVEGIAGAFKLVARQLPPEYEADVLAAPPLKRRSGLRREPPSRARPPEYDGIPEYLGAPIAIPSSLSTEEARDLREADAAVLRGDATPGQRKLLAAAESRLRRRP